MKRYILLLRGINVGGKNTVSMKTLKKLMETKGFIDVITYINSGNVIFSSEETDVNLLKNDLEALLLEGFDLNLKVLVLPTEDFFAAVNHAPSWWDSNSTDKNNAIFVIPPMTAEEIIEALGEAKPEYEKVAFYGRIIYWTAPLETFSKTRWSQMARSSVYESITIRNANTVKKLVALCRTDAVRKEGL